MQTRVTIDAPWYESPLETQVAGLDFRVRIGDERPRPALARGEQDLLE